MITLTVIIALKKDLEQSHLLLLYIQLYIRVYNNDSGYFSSSLTRLTSYASGHQGDALTIPCA